MEKDSFAGARVFGTVSEQDLELEAFSKFIVALEPWLGEAVLIGGWAHRLYRLDPRARKLDYPPLTTLDGDVAVPQYRGIVDSATRSNATVCIRFASNLAGQRACSDHFR